MTQIKGKRRQELDTRIRMKKNQYAMHVRQPHTHIILDHFLSEKVMVFDNFLSADKHK